MKQAITVIVRITAAQKEAIRQHIGDRTISDFARERLLAGICDPTPPNVRADLRCDRCIRLGIVQGCVKCLGKPV